MAEDTAATTTAAETTATTTAEATAADATTAAETTKTIVSGDTADTREVSTTWPDDWRQRIAGEDKSALKTLERLNDPKALFDKVKNLEKKLNEKTSAPQRPGKDAKPEEVAEYRKALGIPETPDGYLADLKLDGGKVLGDADKPIAESFAAALHEVDAPPAAVAKAVDWYFQHMEKVATAEAEADDAFKAENITTLKEDWGPVDFKRNINAIDTLFTDAPSEVKDLLLGGRTADGKRLGDDARVIRFLAKLATEINPAATVVPQGGDVTKAMTTRIAEIEKMQRENRSAYFKDEAIQKEYRDLLTARDKMQARSQAA